MTNKEKIIEAFYKVKELGWVISHRRSNTGIGKTFEDYVGVVENNLNEPDLYGFEIKSHRTESSSYVTLFTKSPSFPKKSPNAYLRDKFGEYYPNTNMKKLHTSMFANSFNSYRNMYSFKLIHKPEEKRIYIGIFTLGGDELLDNTVYYNYSDIEKGIKKLKNSLFVTAQNRYNNEGIEEFYFDSAEIYTNPTLDIFLKMVDAGEIMYDIRIGSFKSGKKLGKPHDHGSGFRIKECNMIKLYSTLEKL